jgi:hypothetical protein
VGFQLVGSLYHHIIEIAEELAIRRIVLPADVGTNRIDPAPVIIRQMHAPPFNKLIPSVAADINPHGIKMELPFEILDFRSRPGSENPNRKVPAAKGRALLTLFHGGCRCCHTHLVLSCQRNHRIGSH